VAGNTTCDRLLSKEMLGRVAREKKKKRKKKGRENKE